jgi:UDP-2,3-diacylglucosamine pyrophosphatase LpxH
MKIRTGFVTNSSSTSFLIISSGELDEADFFELMGVAPDSPIVDLFKELFASIIRTSDCVDLSEVDWESSPQSWFHNERLTDAMVERLKQASQKGLKAYFGQLSSDDTLVQQFFCTDALEVENDKIYFNYLDCTW